MSEREALLRAVLADPEDDAPRLVYADWLEEHGDPDRAEFIRVQCELARMRWGSPEYAARGTALHARDRELEGAHKKEWVAELNLPKNRHTYYWFARGLVAKVWCTVRYFLDHADAILDSAPVEIVCLRRVTARNLHELAAHPAFARVRGVEFLMAETPADLVARFFEGAPVGRLRTVDLNTSVVNPLAPGWYERNAALAGVLASCPGLAGLKRLRLNHGGVGDEGGLALARSPHLGGLEFLGLDGNPLSAGVESALRERFGRRLCLGQSDLPNFTLGELGWA
jgi:uncharacterized protein (TIGR02996 family)